MQNRSNRRAVLQQGAALAGAVVLAPLSAATVEPPGHWPSRPVRLVVGYPPGGQSDTMARAYCNALQTALGQPFIVDNKPGAGSIIACQEVARAAPDGYTLLYAIQTALVQVPVLYTKLGYDPDKDLTRLAIIDTSGLPLGVTAKLPVKTVPEFIEWAKTAPSVNMGSYGAGSAPHIMATSLNKRYGLKIETVHYKGEVQMWNDVASGAIQMAMGSPTAILPWIQGGTVRAVGIMGKRRLAIFPDLPTLAEQGLNEQEFSLGSYHGILAPGKMAQPLREKISQAVVLAGRADSVRRTLEPTGVERGAADWRAFDKAFNDEAPLIRSIVRGLNITLD